MTTDTDLTQADRAATPASAARALLRSARTASLATLLPDPSGWPFASFVIPATDNDASPLLVLSDLAQHTRNLSVDSRASLLLEGDVPEGNQQATPRITLTGHIRRTDDEVSRNRYMASHPDTYLGVLGDFHLYRMEVERAFYVGGFARARRIEPAELLMPAPALATAEHELLSWLNDPEHDRVQFIAELFQLESCRWRAVGVDAEGCDIVAAEKVARFELLENTFDYSSFTAIIERMLNASRARRRDK